MTGLKFSNVPGRAVAVARRIATHRTFSARAKPGPPARVAFPQWRAYTYELIPRPVRRITPPPLAGATLVTHPRPVLPHPTTRKVTHRLLPRTHSMRATDHSDSAFAELASPSLPVHHDRLLPIACCPVTVRHRALGLKGPQVRMRSASRSAARAGPRLACAPKAQTEWSCPAHPPLW